MAKSRIASQAFSIHEALQQLTNTTDGAGIAEQVLLLEKGLVAEDEVSLLFSWLGKCKLVHKLDQLISPPDARGQYAIPDLLVIFNYKGKEVPVLVEVKTSAASKISWRPDYINRLKRYAEIIGIPLLVACKWKESAFQWTLVEIDVFKQDGTVNYKLTNENAIKSNLMFKLAGNFAIIFREGITWHTEMSRLTPSEKVPGKKNTFRMTAKFDGNDYMTDSHGARLEVPESLWAFFMGQPGPLKEIKKKTKIEWRQPKNTFNSADRIFQKIIAPKNESPYWRELLRTYKIPTHASEIEKLAKSRTNIVETMLLTEPQKTPQFLLEIDENQD